MNKMMRRRSQHRK